MCVRVCLCDTFFEVQKIMVLDSGITERKLVGLNIDLFQNNEQRLSQLLEYPEHTNRIESEETFSLKREYHSL
jgi:hypothetical protein